MHTKNPSSSNFLYHYVMPPVLWVQISSFLKVLYLSPIIFGSRFKSLFRAAPNCGQWHYCVHSSMKSKIQNTLIILTWILRGRKIKNNIISSFQCWNIITDGKRRMVYRLGMPRYILRVCCLAETSVSKIFDSHLQHKLDNNPREAGDFKYEWTLLGSSV